MEICVDEGSKKGKVYKVQKEKCTLFQCNLAIYKTISNGFE